MAALIKCKAPGDTVSEIGFQGDKGVWPIVGGQLEVKELTQQVTNADELLWPPLYPSRKDCSSSPRFLTPSDILRVHPCWTRDATQYLWLDGGVGFYVSVSYV